jgi:hypothetical protein
MFQMVMLIIKWVSFPALLIGSMFWRSAASYGLMLDFVICLGATMLVQRAVCSKQYLSAAGLVSIAVIFSPLLLAVKIFLLMGVTCIATVVVLLAAFRTQPLPAV